MTQKLPAWVEVGAFVLALIAGLINVVGLLGFQHQSVSHLTGTVSLFSLKIVLGEWLAVQHFMGVMLSFFMGAILSGLIIQNATLKLGRRYSVALFLESLFLIFALIMLQGNYSAGDFWASAACGLQNAMISTYSGAVIRTTHVTGTVTDLGALIGQYLRGHSIDKRKIGLYLILLGGFIAGGLIGAYGFLHYSFYVLLIPIIGTQILAILYAWYWYKQNLKSH